MSCGRCGVHNCVDSEDAFSFGCFSRLSYLRQITKQNKPLAVRVRACAGIINLELTECCVSPPLLLYYLSRAQNNIEPGPRDTKAIYAPLPGPASARLSAIQSGEALVLAVLAVAKQQS